MRLDSHAVTDLEQGLGDVAVTGGDAFSMTRSES